MRWTRVVPKSGSADQVGVQVGWALGTLASQEKGGSKGKQVTEGHSFVLRERPCLTHLGNYCGHSPALFLSFLSLFLIVSVSCLAS